MINTDMINQWIKHSRSPAYEAYESGYGSESYRTQFDFLKAYLDSFDSFNTDDPWRSTHYDAFVNKATGSVKFMRFDKNERDPYKQVDERELLNLIDMK